MGQFYEVLECEPRGEWNSNYGVMKNYALRLSNPANKEVVTGEVQLSQKPETARPLRGDRLYGTITTISGRKGDFLKFKKEQIPDELQPAARMSQAPTKIGDALPDVGDSHLTKKIDYIISMLESLVGEEESEAIKDRIFGTRAPEEDIYEEIPNEPIDLSNIPF